MPKISRKAYLARRANIMAAARRSFARHGINVSVDEICAEAGVSKGALYGYFRSKQAIIEAIAEEHGLDIDRMKLAPDVEALQGILLEAINHGDPLLCRLELEAWTHSLKHDALHGKLTTNLAHLRSAVTAALQRMQDEGTLRLHLGAEATATVLVTFSVGLIASSALANGIGKDATDAAFSDLFALLGA